jgi:phage terminase large subunit-like protein
MNWITEYAKQIKSGKIVTSKRVAAVYSRLEEEIRFSKKQKRSRYMFNEALGEHPIKFIEQFCKKSQGDFGADIELELFQKAFVQAIFGFICRETGLRRFREAMLLMGRKNGKSTLAAALGLYLMIADGEGAAEIYSAATKRDQAMITLNEAINMRHHSRHIAAITKKRRNDIYFPATASKFVALASDSNTLDGLNSHGVIVDELHAIRDPDLYRVLKKSTGHRRQPLILTITTAGTVRESIFDTRYDYACKIADGEETDDRFLPILYELDAREEWTRPECWIKANPGLGPIKQWDTLREDVEQAKILPEELPDVLCKHFNIRENEAASWLSFEVIESTHTFEMEKVYNTYAVGGCDLSATTDLTCATLLIRKPDDPTVYVLQQYFLPEERVKRMEATERSAKEAPYRAWAERGLLTICESSRVEYSLITAWFTEMREKHKIDAIYVGYDRAFAGYWLEEMKSNGFTTEPVAQGPYTWSQPMREMGAAFADKIVNYNRNPILAWCLSNTGVKKSGMNNIQPVKITEKRRIDGMVSLLNAWVVYVRKFDDFMYNVG